MHPDVVVHVDKFKNVKTLDQYHEVRDEVRDELISTQQEPVTVQLPYYDKGARKVKHKAVQIPRWVSTMAFLDGSGLSVQLLGPDQKIIFLKQS